MNKLLLNFGVSRIISWRLLATRLTADGKEITKRKNFENRITLIGTDDSVSITDLKNAENLSIRRDLKLVKIQDVDAKARRPIYKLMTNTEYHNEELENRKLRQASHKGKAKGVKVINLSSKIAEHDLMTSVKKMIKLLQKQYEVKVVITRESGDEERIYSVIESNIKSSGKIAQKRTKGNTLRFQLLPSQESSLQVNNSSEPSNNQDDKGPL